MEPPPAGPRDRPLRVAVVGAGPAGFYAAQALLKGNPTLEVDLLERLPTPYGLVRDGVAPDHQKIKNVTRVYERIAAEPRVRYFGGVDVGRALSVEALLELYDQAIFTVGAPSSRDLRIPGEDLPGSWTATDLVGWYNGHPDFTHLDYDLSQVTTVVVVGVGNVAIDVARILLRDPEELASTDISEAALSRLRSSSVQQVVLLGRRGLAQAKFSAGELHELAEVTHLRVRAEDLALDALSLSWLETLPPNERKAIQRNLDFLAAQDSAGEGRHVDLRMCTSPTEMLQDQGRVAGLRLEANELVPGWQGNPSAKGTGTTEVMPCQAVVRAVGYRGVALPGLPFDERRGVVPNEAGRVLDQAQPVPRTYVAGWIKRGPSGLIGENKADAVETVAAMLQDAESMSGQPERSAAATEATLRACAPALVTWQDWLDLDARERACGDRLGRVRQKYTSFDERCD